MTPERYRRLIKTLDKRQPGFTILTEQIHKPRNIAALVRTADAVGMCEVNMVWPWQKHRAYSGAAMGSDRWVELRRHEDMLDAICTLKHEGMRIYAAHFSSSAIDYSLVDYTVPCALLLGNEKKGVSEQAAQLVDQHVVIPMYGMVESLNVSVAAAIILAQARRQRELAGLYDKVQLDEETYWRMFFRWAHPQVAKYCDDHGLEYPDVNREDGELVEPAAWFQRVRQQQALKAE